MFKRLIRALRTVEGFHNDAQDLVQRMNGVEEGLLQYRSQLAMLQETQGALEASVSREVLNMAELYGKTYRLLKRMQAEARADEVEPDIQPEPVETDPVSARVQARRHSGLSSRDARGQG